MAKLDPQGAWWCARGAEYIAVGVALGGAQLARIRGNAPEVPVRAAVRDSAVAAFEKRVASLPGGGAAVSRIPKSYPRIDEIDVDDKGRLWVRRRAPGGGLALDVWSRNGVQLATLDAPLVFQKYLPLVIRDDRLYTVVPDEDGVPFVVRYRIVR
jgi:hypothetical protein